VDLHRLKDLLAEITLLQQVAEGEDRGFFRDPLADQVDACNAPHGWHFDQRILHRRVAEVVPLLHQVGPQHGLQRVGWTAAFGAALGLAGLDQIDQRLPGDNGLPSEPEIAPSSGSTTIGLRPM